jgi:hypothetical protein
MDIKKSINIEKSNHIGQQLHLLHFSFISTEIDNGYFHNRPLMHVLSGVAFSYHVLTRKWGGFNVNGYIGSFSTTLKASISQSILKEAIY